MTDDLFGCHGFLGKSNGLQVDGRPASIFLSNGFQPALDSNPIASDANKSGSLQTKRLYRKRLTA
jgi:hypothetical protein